MRTELESRLQKVAKKLHLIHRLRRVAFSSEEELIDRMGQRSNKVLLDIRSKFLRAVREVESGLGSAQPILTPVLADAVGFISNTGAVNPAGVEAVKSDLNEMYKKLSQATKGSTAVLHLFNSLDRLVTVGMLASILQNRRMLDRAKTDAKVRDKLYSVMEQMAQVVPRAQEEMRKAVESSIPKSDPVQPKQEDSTAEEAVIKQLTDAEVEMNGVVAQLARLLTKKAAHLFGPDSEMVNAIEENIFAIYNKRKTNPILNRDKSFYQDALHLDHSPTKIDLGEFLDTKQKKAIYLCYRSFVMAARALGVVQHVKSKPETILKNPKLQELVVKAQQILMKRKDTIVKYLQALTKQENEQKDKEKGIPKGTFSDFFDTKPTA